jgi:hypothetical protein
MLDIEHQGEAIGELVSLFRGESGHAWAVAVSDHDWLAEFPEPLYFSAAFRSRFDPDNLELDAVALTTESATLSKEPVEIWRGQLSSRYDRSSWHLDGVRKRVVEHAAGELRARSKRESILIRDELPPVADDYPPLRPGTYVRGAERPAGGLRHSGPAARFSASANEARVRAAKAL